MLSQSGFAAYPLQVAVDTIYIYILHYIIIIKIYIHYCNLANALYIYILCNIDETYILSCMNIYIYATIMCIYIYIFVYLDYVVHRWEISCTKLMIPTSRVFFAPRGAGLDFVRSTERKAMPLCGLPSTWICQSGRTRTQSTRKKLTLVPAQTGCNVEFLRLFTTQINTNRQRHLYSILNRSEFVSQVNKSAGDLPTGMIAGLDMASTGSTLW